MPLSRSRRSAASNCAISSLARAIARHDQVQAVARQGRPGFAQCIDTQAGLADGALAEQVVGHEEVIAAQGDQPGAGAEVLGLMALQAT